MSILWKEIPESLYTAIFQGLSGDLTVFGAYTNLENSSRFDAGIMTEWGLRDTDFPLIKIERKPESQSDVGEVYNWPAKFYIASIKESGEVVG